MLIFDGDYPMAPVALDYRRDLTQPVAEIRRRDDTKGNVAFCRCPRCARPGSPPRS